MNKEISLCFIISCKVYKQYKIYLPFYISNIKEYYPTALIILVDNNSEYNEYYNQFKGIDNIVLLENTSKAKFELGAYKFATEYIIKNNLMFDYYVCVQDTFVLVNKYDFNTLRNDNVKACTIQYFEFNQSLNLHVNVLSQLNLYDPTEKFSFCWCSSWCCDHENLLKINEMLYSITPITRNDSEQTERYMGKILKMLNNNVFYSIVKATNMSCGYNCLNIDPTSEFAKRLGHHFIKSAQQKNEGTPQ
jgi:hypothetical protein